MSGDPRWARIALRLYSACLYLYPPRLRQAHGQDMRQVFRDRCRELAARGQSPWRLLAENVPDLASSLGESHLAAARGADARPRILAGLAMLAMLALTLATQARWSGDLLEVMDKAQWSWGFVMEAREFKRQERQVGRVAGELAARPEASSQALAAVLHRSLYDQRMAWHFAGADTTRPTTLRVSQEGELASRLAGRLASTGTDGYTLGLAVMACSIEAGCYRDRAIRRLLAVDPGNAFGWMQAFKWASAHGDADGMAAAMAGIGRSNYYDDRMARMYRELFDAAGQVAPGDTGLLADITTQAMLVQNIGTGEYRHDARLHCLASASTQDGEPRWIDRGADARAQCRQLGRVLAASGSLQDVNWARLLLKDELASLPPVVRRNLDDAPWIGLQMYRHRLEIGRHLHADGRGWEPWDEADWRQWAAAWGADGEIASMKRWLASRGIAPESSQDRASTR